MWQVLTDAEYEVMAATNCYSMCFPASHHIGYERVLLPEVSSEMIHIHDAQDAELGAQTDEGGCLGAVAYRRKER